MTSKLTGEGDAEAEVKKNIAIFGYEQRLLSIEMKTKVVQHVPRIIFNIYKIQKLKLKKVDPRHMLNKFCFHLYAQNSLFIGENCNGFVFDTLNIIITLTCEFRVHRAGSQLKMSESQTKAGSQ